MNTKRPSAELVYKARLAKSCEKSHEISALEEWADLLDSISIGSGSFLPHRDGFETVTTGNLMDFHMCLDFLPEADDLLMLAAYFRKGNAASIDSEFFGDENRASNKSLHDLYSNFLGFTGTWEEVTLKIIELNNFVISQNTIPPIP